MRGVGEKAILAILKVREADGDFKSLYDFCERVPLGSVNRSTIEALVKCGAFDSIHGEDKRASLCEAIDGAIKNGQRAAADRDAGQMNFFDGLGGGGGAEQEVQDVQVALPEVPKWSEAEQLKYEKEVLGFFLSYSPLDTHDRTIRSFANATIEEVHSLAANAPVTIGGMLTRVRPTVVKNGRSAGQRMAMLTIEDKTGTIDAVVFSDRYATAAPILEVDKVVFLKGKVDRKREEPSIVVDEVYTSDEAPNRLCETVRIVLRHPRRNNPNPYNGELKRLREMLTRTRRHDGANANLYFEIHQDGQAAILKSDITVTPSASLPQWVSDILDDDPDCCQLLGPVRLVQRRDAGRLKHNDAEPRERLRRNTMEKHGSCASIDRY